MDNIGLLPLMFIVGSIFESLFLESQLIYPFPNPVFPTRYRGTCYAISAAFGTFGRIISDFFLPENSPSSQVPSKLGLKLVVNCVFMCRCYLEMDPGDARVERCWNEPQTFKQET
jgi:hypothetical protein